MNVVYPLTRKKHVQVSRVKLLFKMRIWKRGTCFFSPRPLCCVLIHCSQLNFEFPSFPLNFELFTGITSSCWTWICEQMAELWLFWGWECEWRQPRHESRPLYRSKLSALIALRWEDFLNLGALILSNGSYSRLSVFAPISTHDFSSATSVLSLWSSHWISYI